jgi:hypothetical protein
MAQLQQATINATQFLDNHLRERRQCPERVEKIDAQIRDRLGATRAVVVLDMVGFSRQTETAGIIATLAKIQVSPTSISLFCHFRQRKTQLRIQSFSCISRMGISST